MGTQQVRALRDVRHGPPPSRLRLLAPLRYLGIRHREKTRYDFIFPTAAALAAWGIYWLLQPKPPIFGDDGLLRFARDLLTMAVPFIVGSLGVVATGLPGPHFEVRPKGAELRLDGKVLTLRQFVCYLLGYLSFLGLVTLAAVVAAGLMKATVIDWIGGNATSLLVVRAAGTFVFFWLLSALTITVFWSLYFLTDVVNQTD